MLFLPASELVRCSHPYCTVTCSQARFAGCSCAESSPVILEYQNVYVFMCTVLVEGSSFFGIDTSSALSLEVKPPTSLRLRPSQPLRRGGLLCCTHTRWAIFDLDLK